MDDTTAILEGLSHGYGVIQRRINRFLESTLEVPDLIDPRDAYTDPVTGEIWAPVGAYGSRGNIQMPYRNEQELANVRNLGRWFQEENEFAINVHENRISYVVGWGHCYEVVARNGRKVADTVLQQVKDVVDRFLQVNRWSPSYVRGNENPGRASWGFKQPQNLLRRDREGECIIRKFRDEGTLKLRYVEPESMATPEGMFSDRAPYGIECDPDDAETVIRYFIDDEPVDASEIQHRTRGGGPLTPRGVPINYAVRKNLHRAQKILRNGSLVTELQTAIGMIRKHAMATSATVQALTANNATRSTTDSNGNTTYQKRYAPGTILDASANIDYEFPGIAIDPGRYIASLQGELRAIAARHCMPEFMVSSDASNANFSSTMVAEGPAVKMFERLQWDEIAFDLELIWEAVTLAVEAQELSAAVLTEVDILAEAPQVRTRNLLEESQRDETLNRMKVKSARTIALENDLDYDQEQENFKDEAKLAEELMPPDLRLALTGAGGPDDDGGDDDAPGNRPPEPE